MGDDRGAAALDVFEANVGKYVEPSPEWDGTRADLIAYIVGDAARLAATEAAPPAEDRLPSPEDPESIALGQAMNGAMAGAIPPAEHQPSHYRAHVRVRLRERGYDVMAVAHAEDRLAAALAVAEDASRQAHAFMHYGAFADCAAGICAERRAALAADPSASGGRGE